MTSLVEHVVGWAVVGVGGVFIDYRGDDSDTAAVLIDRELVARFGDDLVFLASRSIPAGADFVEQLLARVRSCSVLLVAIGPRWLTVTDGPVGAGLMIRRIGFGGRSPRRCRAACG